MYRSPPVEESGPWRVDNRDDRDAVAESSRRRIRQEI